MEVSDVRTENITDKNNYIPVEEPTKENITN